MTKLFNDHASISIATYILGGRQWHSIWQIRWSTTRYWRILRLWSCVLWRAGWLLMNPRQLRWINDLIIQWRRHRYHWWWQIISLWFIVLANKAPVIMRSRSLPTLIVPCSTFVLTTNTLCTWHDEYNMRLWWYCVPVILFVDGHKNMRSKFLARQLQSCLSFITRNKIDYELFVSV